GLLKGAQARNMTCLPVLNPLCVQPEDLSIPFRKGADLKWTFPSVLERGVMDTSSDQKFFLLVDELDKARPENVNMLLSLFDFQTRIRDTIIPPQKIRIAAAMNPAMSPLPDALLGRLFMLRYPVEVDVNEAIERPDISSVKSL